MPVYVYVYVAEGERPGQGRVIRGGWQPARADSELSVGVRNGAARHGHYLGRRRRLAGYAWRIVEWRLRILARPNVFYSRFTFWIS